MILAKYYLIRGRVQGVGYRFFAREAARRHKIVGYVRNLPTGGTVEVHAEATEDALRLFKNELKQGPPAAYVDDIEESDADVSGHFSAFSVR